MLILLGFGGPILLTNLLGAADETFFFALAIDGFRLLFLLGIALLIIGLLRNWKTRKDEGPRT